MMKMHSTPANRQLCAFIAAVALLAASVPVGAIALVEHLQTDVCCAGGAGQAQTGEGGGADPIPGEDCCPTGCHDCLSRCCTGFVFLHTASMALSTDQPAQRAPSDYDKELSPAHTRAVYHPPRR